MRHACVQGIVLVDIELFIKFISLPLYFHKDPQVLLFNCKKLSGFPSAVCLAWCKHLNLIPPDPLPTADRSIDSLPSPGLLANLRRAFPLASPAHCRGKSPGKWQYCGSRPFPSPLYKKNFRRSPGARIPRAGYWWRRVSLILLFGRLMATNVLSCDFVDEIQEGLRLIGTYVNLSEVNFNTINREQLNFAFERGDKLRILIVGRTGTGKSTLVNGLIGQKIAEEGGFSTSGTTVKVIPYKIFISGVEVTLIDSPGLQDGTENEDKYLKEMKCCDVDLVIFAIRITDSKFVHRNPDAIAMTKMTESFGVTVWKKALVVLTHANAVEAMNPQMNAMDPSQKTIFFKKLVCDFQHAIHNTLMEDARVPREIAEVVKVVPTGHESIQQLVDGTLWFSNFWLECLTSIQSAEARAAMIKLNVTRFRSKNVTERDFIQHLTEQPIILSSKTNDYKKLTLTLGSIGGFGLLGAGIGCIGLVGGPIGLVGIPVGLYVGMVIGALLSASVQQSK